MTSGESAAPAAATGLLGSLAVSLAVALPSFCFLNYFCLCRVVFGFYITCDGRIDVKLLFVAAAGAAGSPTRKMGLAWVGLVLGCWIAGCLADLLACWLAGWLAGCLYGCLPGRLNGFACWLAGWLAGWFS